MKSEHRYLILIVIILLICQTVPAYAAGEPYVSADAAVLMDARTGQVLYERNPHKRRAPASTTKIMTALLALEIGRMDQLVTVSPQAARVEGSSIYLQQGEQISFADLVSGALIKSGNDACAAIAEYIAGGIGGFAELMNLKAIAIGAWDTHFVNPHGLPAREHYTTAYDLGLIAVHALRNEKFAEIVSTREKTIDGPGEGWDRRLTNTNQMLWKYNWADGVKTGTTSEAGQCLVTSASKDSRRLVAVVLRSGDRYVDTIKMLEYGFDNFEHRQVTVAGEVLRMLPVREGMSDRVAVKFAADLAVLVPKNRPEALEIETEITPTLAAPVLKGQKVGMLKVNVDGRTIGNVELVASAAVPERTWWRMFKKWVSDIKY